MSKQANKKAVTIMLSPSVLEAVKGQAKKSGRSVKGQILFFLQGVITPKKEDAPSEHP